MRRLVLAGFLSCAASCAIAGPSGDSPVESEWDESGGTDDTTTNTDGDDHSGADSGTDPDVDEDGFPASDDCDDSMATVHPGALETCDGRDEDCDGEVDEDAVDAVNWYPDLDGDGFGDAASAKAACSPPAGWGATGGDCDDARPAVRPGASEVCGDGLDNDCVADATCRETGVLSVEAYGRLFPAPAPLPASVTGEHVAAVGDVSGDGRSDFVFGGELGGAVFLVLGQDVPVDATPLVATRVEARFGSVPAQGQADLTGDGVLDLLVTRNDLWDGPVAEILVGPLTAPQGSIPVMGRAASLFAPRPNAAVVASAAGASFAVRSPDGSRSVYLFSGPFVASDVLDIDDADAVLVGGPAPWGFGAVVSPCADIDADGARELLVAHDDSVGNSMFCAFETDVSGFLGVDDALNCHGTPESVRDAAIPADFNADGYEEVLFSTGGPPWSGETVLWVIEPVSGALVERVHIERTPPEFLSGAVASVGDVDGDDYQDFVAHFWVWGATTSDDTAGARLYFGSPEGFDASTAYHTPVRTLGLAEHDVIGSSEWGALRRVAGIGDLDGDGTPDVAFSDSSMMLGEDGMTGGAWVLFGSGI